MILQFTRPVQGSLRQSTKLDNIANNLANADTSGYKKDFISFDEHLRAQMNVDLTQGDLKTTNGKMDFALADEGFFKIQTSHGIRYSRDGHFVLGANGRLETPKGDPVMGVDGPIFINGNDVQVGETGLIEVDGEAVGQFSIVTLDNLKGLQKEGTNLFVNKDSNANEVAPARVSVKQGALERSNVNVVEEMSKMIDTHRKYETFSKVITSFDETDQKLITEVGRVG